MLFSMMSPPCSKPSHRHLRIVRAVAKADRLTDTASPFTFAPLSFLRSYLFVAIFSLLVLTGYGNNVFGDCCANQKLQQTHCAKTESHEKAPCDADGCQCLCHQAISHITAEPVCVAAAVLLPVSFTAYADEFPLDAVPIGIDHPPQLS
jgi:hypothetical protein